MSRSIRSCVQPRLILTLWRSGSTSYSTRFLETVVRMVDRLSGPFNIITYEHSSLRDADSERHDPMYQFGLMRSDYTAKPAFATYRDLIDELRPRGLSLTTVDARLEGGATRPSGPSVTRR